MWKLGTSDVSKWWEGDDEEQHHSSQGELRYLSDVTEQEERTRRAIATSVVFCKSNLCGQVTLILKSML
jgi:hypothetical protein